MSEAVREHPDLVRQHFMKLVPPTDHKFVALHGAVRSGGTFIHIPKGIKLTDPLQAYFRMNTLEGGQFEHTLIILEDETQGDYIEGCSAPKFDKRSLHAGCVEIFVGKNAKMRYSSVENWSLNTFNLNTKRALVEENSFMEWIGGNLGSGATMLYPCSILKGDNAKADNISVVVASKGQHQDVGAKVIHLGKNTSSNIISKSISKDGGISTYRGLIDIHASALNATTSTKCDALLLDGISRSDTIPSIKSHTNDATISHEAAAGKIDTVQLFYLMSRGLSEEKAMAMLVNGFISSIVKKLPLEYAGELNHLIELEMEGSIG
jgi:Fe-S cluster assembly protein SufB